MNTELFTKCKVDHTSIQFNNYGPQNKHDYELIYNKKGEKVWTMVWVCKECNMVYVDYEEV
jgi:hypothetical protein